MSPLLFPRFLWAAVWFGLCSLSPALAMSETEEDRLILEEPKDAATPPIMPDHRLALGVSYIGAQVRLDFTKKWAGELQFQTGKASSDYGDVRADVFGVRAYRYGQRHGRVVLYLGPEFAYTTAKSAGSDYKTRGFVLGAFGGFDYYLVKQLSLGIDIGPYFISLKEQQTGLTQATLDIVVNTTLNWHLF